LNVFFKLSQPVYAEPQKLVNFIFKTFKEKCFAKATH